MSSYRRELPDISPYFFKHGEPEPEKYSHEYELRLLLTEEKKGNLQRLPDLTIWDVEDLLGQLRGEITELNPTIISSLGLDRLFWDVIVAPDQPITSALLLGFHPEQRKEDFQDALGTIYVNRIFSGPAHRLIHSNVSIAGVTTDSRGTERIVGFNANRSGIIAGLNTSVFDSEQGKSPYAGNSAFRSIPTTIENPGETSAVITRRMQSYIQRQGKASNEVIFAYDSSYGGELNLADQISGLAAKRGYVITNTSEGHIISLNQDNSLLWSVTIPNNLFSPTNQNG